MALDGLSRYWAATRELYYPFEEGLKAPGPDVYQHEMPGGQYTNLRQQARGLGLDNRWTEICLAYAEANRLFGDIVKVTPSSKVVGDMALFMVANFHFASGAMFQSSYLMGQNGLVYLLIFPVLLTGRAGVGLGLDGILGRSMRSGPRPF